MLPSTAPTNRLALFSFFCAFLTLTSFCVGFAPFLPLTAPLCYPIAVFLGLVALALGFTSLRQIRTSGEKGRGMALISIWIGALTIFAVLCFTTLTVMFIYYGADYLNNNWPQFKP